MLQAKQHQKSIHHAQRELFRQRETVAVLRAENAVLREKNQLKMKEQNEVLEEVHLENVNKLMNLKYEIEEQVEHELEQLEVMKRQYRGVTKKVKTLQLADKSNLYDEREHIRTLKRDEDKIEIYVSKHSEEVSYGKKLRQIVNDLRLDKMNFQKKIEEKQQELDARSAEAVQLINIANQFYTQRAQYRLVASSLIADAGKEAEVHRVKMQELSNRIEYYELVMQEREEEYRNSIQEAERQASNLNDPSEELKEAEKKRQQELIEAFDKVMYTVGIWDIELLVSHFLRKEEKMALQKNYLDALTDDSDKIENEIKTLRDEVVRLGSHKPEEMDEVIELKSKISEQETKSTEYRLLAESTFETLNRVANVLAGIKLRMNKCRALDFLRPVRRRWALLRANIARVPTLSSQAGGKAMQGKKVLGTNYDPRRKTIFDEFNVEEVAPQGVVALNDISQIEENIMALLAKAQIGRQMGSKALLSLTKIQVVPVQISVEAPVEDGNKDKRKGKKKKSETGMKTDRSKDSTDKQSDKTPIVSARSNDKQISVHEPIREEKAVPSAVFEQEPDLSLFPGPRFGVNHPTKGRATMEVIPSLKEIDSPRDSEALSPSEIRKQVLEGGYSEKVNERIQRARVCVFREASAKTRERANVFREESARARDRVNESERERGRMNVACS